MESPRQSATTSIGLLILRLGIGGYMLTHGLGKVAMLRAGDFEKMGNPIGLGNELSLVLVTTAEFLCALLVIAGLGTRFAAAVIVIAMAVAAFVAHGGDPWTSAQAAELFMAGDTDYPASKEPALMYLVVFLTLVFTGAGTFSIDGWIRGRSGNSTSSTTP